MVPLPCSKCPVRSKGRNLGIHVPKTLLAPVEKRWTAVHGLGTFVDWARGMAQCCHRVVTRLWIHGARGKRGAVRYTGGRPEGRRSVAGADFDGHHRGDVAEEVHRDLKGPDGLDRLLQDEVVAIDLDPLLLLDGFRDVGTGDRAEEPATGAGSCRDEDVAPASTLAWASAAPRSFASRRSRVRRMEAAWR